MKTAVFKILKDKFLIAIETLANIISAPLGDKVQKGVKVIFEQLRGEFKEKIKNLETTLENAPSFKIYTKDTF